MAGVGDVGGDIVVDAAIMGAVIDADGQGADPGEGGAFAVADLSQGG